jgi:tRNA (guanine26-N2/guanine27-N2)-dimethyltransferase
MFQNITEANITIQAPKEKKISKDLPVFYNPAMKLNRDISVLLLRAIDNTSMQVCDLLAGSGIRSIRLLAELPRGKMKNITINDNSQEATKLIKKNIAANKKEKAFQSSPDINVTCEDANLLLYRSTGFDYIDIDPFGTPNPFLDSACRRISRGGILAVTATDTSSLAGTFPKTCMRKYWAVPKLDANKHETGLRILIRKCQLVAAQYDRALIPIFSYSKEHYMRVFFRAEKGKTKTDKILRQHGHRADNLAGPLWLGQLWDRKLVTKMKRLAKDIDYDFDSKFLDIITEESGINTVGFHDIHNLCKKNHIGVPQFDAIESAIKKKGFKVSRTHFTGFGLRSDIKEADLISIIRHA